MGASRDRGGKCQVGDVGIDVVSVSDHAGGEGTVGAIPNGQDLCLQALEHGLNAQAEEDHGQGTALADSRLAFSDQHSRGEEELRWFAIQRSKQAGHTWAPVHDGIEYVATGETVEGVLYVQLDDGQILKT